MRGNSHKKGHQAALKLETQTPPVAAGPLGPVIATGRFDDDDLGLNRFPAQIGGYRNPMVAIFDEVAIANFINHNRRKAMAGCGQGVDFAPALFGRR